MAEVDDDPESISTPGPPASSGATPNNPSGASGLAEVDDDPESISTPGPPVSSDATPNNPPGALRSPETNISAGIGTPPGPVASSLGDDPPNESTSLDSGERGPGFGERLSGWWEKTSRRWSIILLPLLLILLVLGTLADWQGVKPVLPCWAKSEQRISEPYGIAVANIAVRLNGGQHRSSGEEQNAQDINQALFAQVASDFQDLQGKVGIGQTCKQDIESADRRQAYLSEVQDRLNADLAVSLILTPSGQRVVAEVELSVGSREEWNEAQELAGYFKFGAGTVGDSLEIKTSISNASIAELLTPYIKMLRAIATYANSQYDLVRRTLDEILATPGISDDLKKLAFVLKGNSEGRLDRPGSLGRAAAAFRAALAIDKSYARAILGLAEIDYQVGLSTIRYAGAKCDGELTPQAKAYLDSAIQKFENVYSAADVSRVPDVDVRAKYGIGRTYACMLRLGDSSKAEAAIKALKYVTDNFESDEERAWLRPAASGAYGDLALIYCIQRHREDALANYDKAYNWAVDDARAKEYEDARKKVGENQRYCS